MLLEPHRRPSKEHPIRVEDLKIAIYIPAYNGASTIPTVLDRIPEDIRRLAAEIFIVDNASSDATSLVGLTYAERNSTIRPLTSASIWAATSR